MHQNEPIAIFPAGACLVDAQFALDAIVTPALCLAAVTVSGTSLAFVPNQLITVPLCLAPIEQSQDACESVRNALRKSVHAALAGEK